MQRDSDAKPGATSRNVQFLGAPDCIAVGRQLVEAKVAENKANQEARTGGGLVLNIARAQMGALHLRAAAASGHGTNDCALIILSVGWE